MKIIITGIFLLLISVKSIAQKQFVVDGDAEMRTISGSFNSIKVSGSIDLYLSQSDNEAVAVSAPESRFKDAIKTVVKDNQLNIFYAGDGNWNLKNKKLVVYVSFSELKKLIASGASDILTAGVIKVPSLEIQMSGASDFKGAVEVGSLELKLSGASDVFINGTAADLNIESSGASDVKGYGLAADNCTARASGASDIQVTVNKELKVNASGASKILYKGEGVIKEISNTGASTVTKKG